jgi:hypothetical protein
MRLSATTAAAVLGIMSASCSSGASAPPPATTEPLPSFPVGQIGVPIRASGINGGTADITMDSAEWTLNGAIVHFTIAGTSQQPFKYDDGTVLMAQHWDLSGPPGLGLPGFNYVAANRMPPLGRGSVTMGESVRGFVGKDNVGSKGTWYFEIRDPEQDTAEAGWKVNL